MGIAFLRINVAIQIRSLLFVFLPSIFSSLSSLSLATTAAAAAAAGEKKQGFWNANDTWARRISKRFWTT